MSERKSIMELAAARLRELVRATEAGELLGSEESLVEKLGVSRATVRQVARLLEREGLLRVRRGTNGGYFSARPDLETIEAAVSGYLATLDMDLQDVTVIASVLWVETVRKAASLRTAEAKATAEELRRRLTAVKPDTPFMQLVALEKESRNAIFDLTRARYIELIFQINIAFARKCFSQNPIWDDMEAHRRFVDDWRKAKLLELDAISDGDTELAVMAARHTRNLWHHRTWSGAAGEQERTQADPHAAEPAASRRLTTRA